MDPIDEQFGNRLVRVIKSVKRRTKDGGSKTVKQSFHVRNAAPGDQYAASNGVTKQSGKVKIPSQTLDTAAASSAEGAVQEEPAPVEIPQRLTVRYYDIPWKKKSKDSKDRDPVSVELRHRFDIGNRSAHAPKPLDFGAPIQGVMPTDSVLWGYGEPELLSKMRTGRIMRLQLVGQDSGLMKTRLEIPNGTIVNAYMALESLVEPINYSMWGDFYDLKKGEGSIPKRAASSYEVAKACGFDDLVPPTVVRCDKYGEMDPILPQDLLERSEEHLEMIARRTGEHPDTIRKQLSGYAWLQLVREGTNTVDKESWFTDIFQKEGELDRKDVLNHILEEMPEGRRMAFIRTAVLDYLLWIGDRNFGDIAFCDDERHPVHLVSNEISLPSPKKIGMRVLEEGIGQFIDVAVNPKHGVPMLWSDPLLMVATRGSEEDLDTFEKIGIFVSSRMKSDRAIEVANSLLAHDVPPISIAGFLSRVWFLATHSKTIARDPFFVAQYYAKIISGQPQPEMKGVSSYVNQVMKRVLVKDYDFIAAMRESEEEEE